MRDKQSKPQDRYPCFYPNQRINIIALGIEASYVILRRVLEMHGV
jgi:hypothetical protein